MKIRKNYNTVLPKKVGNITLAAGGATAQPNATGIASETDILSAFRNDLAAGGFAGELDTPSALYLVLTSRLLDKPVSAAVKGESSAGKSHGVASVADFFPARATLSMTSASDKALFHLKKSLRHRVLIFGEQHGASSEQFDYYVRELLSNGYIELYRVKPGKGGHKTERKKTEGPTSFITTSTSDLHPENETRLLALHVDESREATANIMKAIARGHDGSLFTAKPKYTKGEWKDFQTWLSTQDNKVIIPFAQNLAEMIPPTSIRLRRDFGKLVSLIAGHTLLHRKQRVEESGHLLAQIDDYRAVWKIMRKVFSRGIEQSIDPTIRQTVIAVRDLKTPTVSVEALAKVLGIDKANVGRRFKKAEAEGYLMNRGAGPGRPYAISLGNPLPADGAVLPPPKALQKALKAANRAKRTDG